MERWHMYRRLNTMTGSTICQDTLDVLCTMEPPDKYMRISANTGSDRKVRTLEFKREYIEHVVYGDVRNRDLLLNFDPNDEDSILRYNHQRDIALKEAKTAMANGYLAALKDTVISLDEVYGWMSGIAAEVTGMIIAWVARMVITEEQPFFAESSADFDGQLLKLAKRVLPQLPQSPNNLLQVAKKPIRDNVVWILRAQFPTANRPDQLPYHPALAATAHILHHITLIIKVPAFQSAHYPVAIYQAQDSIHRVRDYFNNLRSVKLELTVKDARGYYLKRRPDLGHTSLEALLVTLIEHYQRTAVAGKYFAVKMSRPVLSSSGQLAWMDANAEDVVRNAMASEDEVRVGLKITETLDDRERE